MPEIKLTILSDEDSMGEDITGYRDGLISYKTIPSETWQAFWQKRGIK